MRTVFDRYKTVNETDPGKASEKVFELHQEINDRIKTVQKLKNGHNCHFRL
jgi:hypothetical protein